MTRPARPGRPGTPALSRPAAVAALLTAAALAAAPVAAASAVVPASTVTPAGPAVAVVPATAAAATTVPTPAAAPRGTVALASGVSASQPQVAVLGFDGTRVLWAPESVGPDDGGVPTLYVGGLFRVPLAGGVDSQLKTLDDGQAGGTSAGSTYVYRDTLGEFRWLDFATGASGDGGTWQGVVAYPGGAVELDGGAPGTTDPATFRLFTTAHPDAGSTVIGTAPDITNAAAATMVADTRGVLAQQGLRLDYLTYASHTTRRLDTAGIPAAGFRCTSVTAGAVGCTDGRTVYRIPTDGSAPVATTAAAVGRVTLTPTTTAWISTAATHRLTTVVGGHRASTSYAVTSAVAAGNGLVVSREGAAVGGVYRIASASSAPVLLARAPVAPLASFAVAVAPGRAGWIDDSTTAFPVRSRPVTVAGSTLRVGAAVTVGPGSLVTAPNLDGERLVTDLALSGRRTLFVGRPVIGRDVVSGTVLLADGTRRTAIATGAEGGVALSGTRLLWGTTAGHVLVRDLATGGTQDLTVRHGLRLAAPSDLSSPRLTDVLYGRYVAYAKGGSAWRLDLVTGRATRLGATDAPAGIGGVRVAGDYVAWPAGAQQGEAVSYRDARTMGATTTLRGLVLASVSQAGLVTFGTEGNRFRRWGSSASRSVPSATARVDGGVLVWVGLDQRPDAAPFPASAARPQSLGGPKAARSVRGGAAWAVELPTSQALTSCTLVVRSPAGAVVARLRCAASDAALGSAVATWRARVGGRAAPAGRYGWQLVARDALGSVLPQTGTPGAPVTGTVVVTR